MITLDPTTVFGAASKVTAYESEEDWLASRQAGIGASESASVFGVGYAGTSPATVWAAKVHGYRPDFSPEQLRRMNRGKKLEPIIADEFSEETGLEIIDPGDFTVYRHAEIDWLFATLDRIAIHEAHGPIPLEIKAVSGLFRRDWDDDEEPPLKYQVQCQHQMAVTGTSHCYLAALVGGDEFRFRLLERNEQFIEAMTKRLTEFWGYVERGEMPPVDESEATGQLLQWLHPHDDGDVVSLPDESADWDRELLGVKDQIKTLGTRKTHLENQIKAAIASATVGELPGAGSYSWKSQTRTGIDSKLIRERYPDIAAECEKVSEFRVLRRKTK